MIKNITNSFKWFFKLEAASGLVLLFSAIVALIISNSNYAYLYFETLNQYIFLGINLTLYFFVIWQILFG